MAAELMPGKKRFTAGSVLADLGLLGWFAFSLFPIVWMVLLSLKSRAEQTTTYFRFSPTLANYHTVLSSQGTAVTSVDFPGALLNSLVNSGAAVLVSLVIGIPAAYAAGRWAFRGSESGSDRDALPRLPSVGFPGPPAAPGVRVSTHRALHVS